MNYEESMYWLWLSNLPKMWYGKGKKYLSIFKYDNILDYIN